MKLQLGKNNSGSLPVWFFENRFGFAGLYK